MVGHTGVMDAAIKAVEAVELALESSRKYLKGGSAIITADHGNAELLWDETEKL